MVLVAAVTKWVVPNPCDENGQAKTLEILSLGLRPREEAIQNGTAEWNGILGEHRRASTSQVPY